MRDIHRIGQMGRFGLGVAMYIYLYLDMSPHNVIFSVASHWLSDYISVRGLSYTYSFTPTELLNRPGVAGAVLQSASSLIH